MNLGSGYEFPHQLSRNAIAKAFGVTDTSIGKWRDAGCPMSKDRTYDLPVVIAWWGERERKNAREEGERLGASGGTTSGSPALERVRESDALSRELKNLRDLGEVVDREKVELDWGRSVTLFSSILQSLPARLAKRLEGKSAVEISAMLDDDLRAAVQQMDEAFAAAMAGDDDQEEELDA